MSWSACAATWSPAARGTPAQCSGCAGVRFTDRSVVGNGHLKGVLDDGRTRVSAIGFQWADRMPWLGDDLVDAAFRIECNEWNGRVTLQARLCALSPACSVEDGKDGERREVMRSLLFSFTSFTILPDLRRP